MVLGEFQRKFGTLGVDLDVLGREVLVVVTETVDLREVVATGTDADRVSNLDGGNGDKSPAQDFNSVVARETKGNDIGIASRFEKR